MYFYAVRQPILNAHKKLYAYEILFRDSLDNVFPDVDIDEANDEEIDAGKFNQAITEFTSKKLAFIKFTLDTLVQGYPQMLNKEEVIIEILEKGKPGKRLLTICKELHGKGYKIALADYKHQSVWTHFYPFIKIIKINIHKSNEDEIKQLINAINDHPHIRLLAEKVETHLDYEKAMRLGFKYFQGYFFAKPQMVKRKNLSPSQLAMTELLYETSKPELDLSCITSIFEHDIPLSYKLLRYANSAIFRRRAEISTIKQALVLLGSSELKRFLGLMFAITANPDKPTELIKLAMTRAKFCELVAHNMTSQLDDSIAFLTGLLSMIDAILDEELELVLAKLPLSSKIKEPLLTRKGSMAAIIKLLEFIEHAQWTKTNIVMEKLELNKEQAVKHYNDALAWADQQNRLAG
ncbi:MAG: HDOD domain-containing protein [Litorilituus sp.]|jgi:EAL and modified HD-GYP domain-containing signal transduction protein|nr:HDOD domain-containing protein [Litorilituus sp.]